MESSAPGIVGIAPGDPWNRRTWSSGAASIFRALARRQALLGAIDALPPEPLELVAKAAAFAPDRERWVERYEYSPLRRALRSRLATRRAAATAAGRPYATLQIGAWYEVGSGRREPLLRASFHDANLALFAREGGFIADPEAPHIRREMAIEKAVFDRMDVIFTLTDWLRDSFIADFDQDPAKVITTGGGPNARTLPSAVPERPPGAPRILFVGFDFERKGGPFLLRAFARLRATHPEAELWIVGPPAGAPAPGVTWHGPIDRNTATGEAELGRLHREANAYVLTSRYEPLGFSLLEAMAYALPCVGSDRGGIAEAIDPPRTGLLVPAEDADALAAALEQLAADPARAAAMGRAGFERVRERYNWDTVAGEDRGGDRRPVRRGLRPCTSTS